MNHNSAESPDLYSKPEANPETVQQSKLKDFIASTFLRFLGYRYPDPQTAIQSYLTPFHDRSYYPLPEEGSSSQVFYYSPISVSITKPESKKIFDTTRWKPVTRVENHMHRKMNF
jgi:hypothetical protein